MKRRASEDVKRRLPNGSRDSRGETQVHYYYVDQEWRLLYRCEGISTRGVTCSVQKDSRGLLSLDGRYSQRDRRPSSTVG